MEALEKNDYYELIHPNTKQPVNRLKAKEIFDLIVKGAWSSGEPGVIFIDKMNKDNQTPLVGDIESTNPCGEVPLLSYEACNLGSINLSRMVEEGADGKNYINWEKLKDTTRLSIHFLDNVIAANNWGKLKTVTQIIAIGFAFIDRHTFGNVFGGGLPVGEMIWNGITTLMMVVCVIATIFSGIEYMKGGKDLFKDDNSNKKEKAGQKE